MASKYKSFGQGKFKYELIGLCMKDKIGYATDITDEFIADGQETWERIYQIKTKNPAVSIIVFSSIDMRTNYTREIGVDAVRVIMKWETKKGILYKKLAKHYRVETLFSNLRNTLINARDEVFSLNGKDFSQDLKQIEE